MSEEDYDDLTTTELIIFWTVWGVIFLIWIGLIVVGFVYASKMAKEGYDDGYKIGGWITAALGIFMPLLEIVPPILHSAGKK